MHLVKPVQSGELLQALAAFAAIDVADCEGA
jgi:hypothetical protein